MSDAELKSDVTALTVQLLSAYLSNNNVASESLADLIRTTKAALTGDAAPEAVEVVPEVHTPAVSVRKSLASPNHIISLIDGKPYKTLKRHLSAHGLTPQTYRERYNLPASYPTVAPTYAADRRAIAERVGLGRGSRGKAAAPETVAASAPTEVAAAAPVAIKPKVGKKPGPKPSAPAGKAPKARKATKATSKATTKAATVTSSAPLAASGDTAAPKRRGRPPKAATSAASTGDKPVGARKLKLALGKKPKAEASTPTATD